ncbi:transient receptor potential cation channel subfamily V member 6-like [Lissotriton helveticus]
MGLSCFTHSPAMLSGRCPGAGGSLQRRGPPPDQEEIDMLQQKRIAELPLLQAAKKNDVSAIQKLLSCPKTDLYGRGAVGETALHVAALYDNLEAAVALLKAAPDLINEPMTSTLYEGETALHIAVLNQNLNLVKELIRRGADVASPRASGTFFTHSAYHLLYFGEHILSFAACMGNVEIVRLLIESGADLRAQDSLGNTVLHILVHQPNKNVSCTMYDLILSYDKGLRGLHVNKMQNKAGFTPFQLAAKEGNATMFEHLVEKMKKKQFCFGPISYTLYDLTEIDNWALEQSILKLVSSSKRKEACRILDLPPMKELVNMKWCKYGRPYFCILAILYVLYMTCFSLVCANRPLKPRLNLSSNPRDMTLFIQKSLQESYETPADELRLVGELISVVGAFGILIIKLPGLLRIRDFRFFLDTVAGGPFHLIIVIHGCLVLVILLMRITNTDNEVVPMSSALVFGWCYIMYFARGFEIVGPFTIMLQKMMFGDLLRFLCLMLLVVLGFGTALYVAFQTEDPNAMGMFYNYPVSLYSTYQLLVLVLNSPANYAVNLPVMYTVVYIAFALICNLLMFNLFIAMMSDTHWRFAQERDELWRLQVVATTVMLEQSLPRFMWSRSGILGVDYGLDNRRYICVEDLDIHNKGETSLGKEEDNLHHDEKNEQPVNFLNKSPKEERKEDLEPFLQMPYRRNISQRKSSRGWQILRSAPRELIQGLANPTSDEEDTYLI